MIRVTKMSGKYYGIVLTDDLEKEMQEIETFSFEGVLSIIVNSLEDLIELGIEEDEVIMVERDDS